MARYLLDAAAASASDAYIMLLMVLCCTEYRKSCISGNAHRTQGEVHSQDCHCWAANFTLWLPPLVLQVPVGRRVRVGKRFGGTIASLNYVLFGFLSGGPEVPLIDTSSWRSEDTACFGGDTLRGETKERWRGLCERAVLEQDPDKFLATIKELLQVLEDREERRRGPVGLRMPPGEKSPRLSCPLA